MEIDNLLKEFVVIKKLLESTEKYVLDAKAKELKKMMKERRRTWVRVKSLYLVSKLLWIRTSSRSRLQTNAERYREYSKELMECHLKDVKKLKEQLKKAEEENTSGMSLTLSFM